MPLVDLSAAPSPSMRRWFGLSLGLLLAILAFLFSGWGHWLNGFLLVCGALVTTVYYAVPKSQIAVIRCWQYLTYPVAWMLGHILFGAIFFGVVLPIGLVLRLRGHDPLQLRSGKRSSYWHDRQGSQNTDRYFKQF
ncbi:MAG: hypothetical protein KDB22_19280 [Planctomycetales bacterium]|nr:hypothetical protein [Planctomycetales bacterium]